MKKFLILPVLASFSLPTLALPPMGDPGFGGLVSFDVADARKVEKSTRLIKNATSLGGVESTMESRYRWEGDRVPEGLLRLSVGLEDAEALWADLEQAIQG